MSCRGFSRQSTQRKGKGLAHLILEYSVGLEEKVSVPKICEAGHQAMIGSGLFPLAGIRVRAYRADHAIIADAHADNDFLAITLNVGAGRSTADLRVAGDMIFAATQNLLSEVLNTPHFALSLEIRVINPELSWKDTPIHKRLTKPTN